MALHATMRGHTFIRVYPQFENNWDSDDPISLEMRALGYSAGLAYQERLSGRQSMTRRQRQARAVNVLKEKLDDAIHDGTIQGVYADNKRPLKGTEEFLAWPLIPLDLLSELQDIADNVSYLQAVSEDAYLAYLQEKEKEEQEGDDPEDDGQISPQRREREDLTEDEVKN